jgi:hypothetical protein
MWVRPPGGENPRAKRKEGRSETSVDILSLLLSITYKNEPERT